MPYIIKETSKGKYKVCKKENPSKCFSNKGLTKKQAKNQMIAIIINEINKMKNKKIN